MHGFIFPESILKVRRGHDLISWAQGLRHKAWYKFRRKNFGFIPLRPAPLASDSYPFEKRVMAECLTFKIELSHEYTFERYDF